MLSAENNHNSCLTKRRDTLEMSADKANIWSKGQLDTNQLSYQCLYLGTGMLRCKKANPIHQLMANQLPVDILSQWTHTC